MSEALSKVFAAVLAVFLLFVYPIKNMLVRQDDTARVFVLTETCKFVDSVRNLGYITPLMYQQFKRSLSATGNTYDISMEHRHTQVYPVFYIDMEGNPVIDYSLNETAYYQDEILDMLFEEIIEDFENRYFLSKGDYFTVKVVNKNKTAATRVQELLLAGDLPIERIAVLYGGMVKDENN